MSAICDFANSYVSFALKGVKKSALQFHDFRSRPLTLPKIGAEQFRQQPPALRFSLSLAAKDTLACGFLERCQPDPLHELLHADDTSSFIGHHVGTVPENEAPRRPLPDMPRSYLVKRWSGFAAAASISGGNWGRLRRDRSRTDR